MARIRLLIWAIPGCLYAIFVFWYTDFGGPLDATEISSYLERFEKSGVPAEARDRIQRFMENDSGRQFLMLNVIDFSEHPPDVVGAEPGESAEELMGRYMEHMFAELLKRACHPTTMGIAVHEAMDLVGVDRLEDAEQWNLGALMRYRSRRTFMEIVTIPETRSRHAFKVAALDKTIAFPIETELYLGDPRWLLGLMALSGAALLDLAVVRRRM
ncbi:MAG: hypothetical protein VCB25_10545 [Myxococcota bacterium]